MVKRKLSIPDRLVAVMRVAECQRCSCRLLLHWQALRPKLQTCAAALAASLCWLLGCFLSEQAGQGS